MKTLPMRLKGVRQYKEIRNSSMNRENHTNEQCTPYMREEIVRWDLIRVKAFACSRFKAANGLVDEDHKGAQHNEQLRSGVRLRTGICEQGRKRLAKSGRR